jgi:hypothetical protein
MAESHPILTKLGQHAACQEKRSKHNNTGQNSVQNILIG